MKKITLLFILSFIFFILHSSAQAPNWQWARGIGNLNDESGNGIAVDNNGNAYSVGYFKSASISFGSNTLINNGGADAYIAKYDAAGNNQWAVGIAGNQYESAWAVTTDQLGSIIVAGIFVSDSIVLGGFTLYNHNSNNGTEDIFIAKFDPSGNVLWARCIGGDSTDDVYSIASDGNGNIYICGYYDSPTIAFDTITLNASYMFIVKYNSNGNAIWAHNSDFGDAWGEAIATDQSGNVYMTGSFIDSTLILGGHSIHNHDASGLSTDVFIAKYDVNGNVLWLKDAGGDSYDDGLGIACDSYGNLFITGNFMGFIMNVDSFTLVNHFGGGEDYFVAKYDTAGNAIWVKGITVGYCHSNMVATDAQGNAYVGGSFGTSVVFGIDTLYADTSIGNWFDMFITQYDPNGNVSWAIGVGGNGSEVLKGIATDANQGIFVTGYLASDTIQFGSTMLFNANTNQSTDIFIAKLSPINCHAHFYVYPDTIPHNWLAVNNSIGAPPISYVWSWGDSTTSTGVAPMHTYSDSGYYNICLTVTDNNGCTSTYCDSSTNFMHGSSTSTIIAINVIDSTSSIILLTGEIEKKNTLLIYPNPTTSKLTIESATAATSFELRDITGKLLMHEAINTKRFEIDLSNYSSGIYFLTVADKDKQVHRKVIRE